MKFESIKHLDFFKVPVNIYLTSTDEELKKKHPIKMGSVAGGILSILSIFLIGAFSIYSATDMFSARKDVYKSVISLNDFNDETFSEAVIQDFHFLPSISVKKLAD